MNREHLAVQVVNALVANLTPEEHKRAVNALLALVGEPPATEPLWRPDAVLAVLITGNPPTCTTCESVMADGRCVQGCKGETAPTVDPASNPAACVCPFPRVHCPNCDNPCRACRFARRAATPMETVRPVCAAWCGVRCGSDDGEECWPVPGKSCFCSPACRDAAMSLNPAPDYDDEETEDDVRERRLALGAVLPPPCACDQHEGLSCHRAADYLVTRAGRRIAVCDRCVLSGDGAEDIDLNPDWSKHRPVEPTATTGAAAPPDDSCSVWGCTSKRAAGSVFCAACKPSSGEHQDALGNKWKR